MTAHRKASKTPDKLIIQQINITQTKRGIQDINTWRNALRSAESAINPKRIDLYDLYSELMLDGHLTAVIEKRKLAVINTPVKFSYQGKNNDKINSLIESPFFTSMLEDLLDAKFWGHTLIELQFLPDEIKYNLIPRKHIDPQKGIIKIRQNDNDGITYRQPPYDKYMLEAGNNEDLGLLLKAAQYVIYKRGGFGDWAQFAELFGMPFRKATYDGYDDNVKNLLQKAMEESGSAPWVIVPQGANVEFVENNTSNGKDLYKELISVCNAEMSKLFLGQTLTSEQGDKGARSLGEVHLEVERQINMADRAFIKNILNYEFKWLLQQHGYLVGEGNFDFEDADRMALKDRFDMDIRLSEKIPIDDDYFYNRYNLPKPKNYAKLRKELDEKQSMQKFLPSNKKNEDNLEVEKNRKRFFDFF